MYVLHVHVVSVHCPFSPADMVDDAGLHQWQLAALHRATESHQAALPHTDGATETSSRGKVRCLPEIFLAIFEGGGGGGRSEGML